MPGCVKEAPTTAEQESHVCSLLKMSDAAQPQGLGVCVCFACGP